MRHDNEFKFNGILFWAKNDNWGKKAASADKKVLFTEETAAVKKEFKLEPADFHFDAYLYGPDTQKKVARLYKDFITNGSGLLEHPDFGKIRVKFAENGFRFKRSETKLDYRELTLDFVVENEAALKIKVVEVEELKTEQLANLEEQAQKSFLQEFNEKFTFQGFPNLVKVQTFENLTAIVNKLSNLTADNLIGDLVDPITASWDILNAAAGGIGQFLQSYLDFKGKASKNKYRAYLDIAKFKPELNSSATSAHPQITVNTSAAADIIRQTALIKACETINDEVFAAKAEIAEASQEILKAAEDIILAADNAVVQNNIMETTHLAVIVLQSLSAAKTRTVYTQAVLPAAVICHQYHCNEADFIKNNKIRHPLFVPAGVPLEVCDD